MDKKIEQGIEIIPPSGGKVSGAQLISDIKSVTARSGDGGISGFLKVLNPLGTIKEIVGEICYYNYQIKVLESEQVKIKEEAKIRHNQIDKAFEVAVKMIDDRRKALENNFKLVAKSIGNHHIERAKIIKSIEKMTSAIVSKDIDIETKKICQSSIPLMSAMLRESGDNATAQLEQIARSTQKALEGLPKAQSLLTFSAD